MYQATTGIVFLEEYRLLGCDAMSLVRIDVSEDRNASIIRAERIKRARNNFTSNQQLRHTAKKHCD
jgi:hypothetical protein